MACNAACLFFCGLLVAVINASFGEESGRALLAAKLTTRAKTCGVTIAKAGSNQLKFRANTPMKLINIAGNVCYLQSGAGYTTVLPGKCPAVKNGDPTPDTWVIPEAHPKYPGWYQIRVLGKPKCWDVIKGKLALFECTKNTRQLWRPILSADGYIQLIYYTTKGCLQNYAKPAHFWPAPCLKTTKAWSQAMDILSCRLL